eukprot:TRINITY_DN3029_c0_g1_i10.p1 TRINITY_DN3029_c0_g1~~TRINITY_DN3029_c0_g1_i10.p1  ORF type:complete len:1472 (-),score=263.93 TRINITY_DN3029_c0_g1_i10:1139-5554(-)
MLRRPPRSTLSSSSAASDVYKRQIREGGKIFRLNPFLSKKVQFEWLKNKKGESKYYNLESTFYEVEEYQLDLKHKLHRDHAKMKESKKETEGKSMAQTSNLLSGRKSTINENNVIYKLLKFQWRKMKECKTSWFDDQEILKFREQDTTRDEWASQQLSLNFSRLISREEKLPTTVADPYTSDLLSYARGNPLQILIIGKPKIGRTTFCKELEQKADIEHIEITKLIDKIMIRMKELEETPEQDAEGNPIEMIDSLGALEWQIIEDLRNGQAIEQSKLIKLVNKALSEKSVAMRGYILDLPLSVGTNKFCWIDAILNNHVILPKIKCRYFTHIIELDDTDCEIISNAELIWSNPETGKVYSQWNREQLRKPLTANEDDPPPDLTEEEEKERQIKDDELVLCPTESPDEITQQLDTYNRSVSKKLNKLIDYLPASQIIRIQSCLGMKPVDVCQAALGKLATELTPLRPLGIKLEAGGEKDLLTQGLEDGKVSRVWSKYYQMDPVELQLKGRVVAGKGEFACEFAGRVFLFDNEENQNEFAKNPRSILSREVEMPRGYNVAVVGPKLSGKKTYARMLADKYNWIVVDVEKIVGEILSMQKGREKHISSNPDPKNQGGLVHLSEVEFKELMKGNAVATKDIIPLILDFLKYPLFKRGKRVIEEEQGEEKEEEVKKEVVDKKAKRPQQKKKEEEALQDAAEIFEDIILAELGVNAAAFNDGFLGVKGVILVGYPLCEDDINLLKWHQLSLDKIMYLIDTSEDQTEPGTYLSSQRREYLEGEVSIENELQTMENIGKVLKEQYTEEVVKDICIIGTIDEVYQRILLQIDPFICRVDEESTVRAQAEMPEGEEIPWGQYGPFCPVTMKDSGWTFYGKEEFEIQIEGKRYRCFGQAELTKLKSNPSKYAKQPATVPPPRVMLTGVRGAGVHTQLALLNEKYRISVMRLKEELLELLENEKEKRKRERKLNKGFKPKELDEEGKEIEDQEILEENAEFDRRKHEIEMIELLFSGYQQILINGNFYDTEEDKVSTPLIELLTESKKLPEIVIMLRVNEKNFFSRQFDQREVKQEYDRLMEERRIKKQEEKEEAKRAAQAAREEAGEENEEQNEEQEEQQQEEEEEEDPDAPKLEEMIQEKKDKLQQQREADLAKIEDYAEQFKAIQVPVIIIDADRNIESVFKNICSELKQTLENRSNLIEKNLVYKLEEEKVQNYEKSYVYKKSIYGDCNALNTSILPIEKRFAVHYRERIYYFANEEERRIAMNQPLQYINKIETMPLDISYAPRIFIIGLPKSGKSSVAKMLSQNLKVVHIKLSHLFRSLTEQHFSLRQKQAFALLQEGKEVPDEVCIALIRERIQMNDCYENGFVLDGYPETRPQAELLVNAGIKPDLVFRITLDEIILKQRVMEYSKEYLGRKDAVFREAEQKEKEKEEENPPEEGEKIFWSEKNRKNGSQLLKIRLRSRLIPKKISRNAYVMSRD